MARSLVAPIHELLAQIRSDLAASADPKFREGVRNFFREPVDAWGVRAPEVKKIARAAYHRVKTWRPAQRDRLANELWKSGKLEEASIAVEIWHRFRKQCAAREFRLFSSWIDRYVRNWANCDGVASWLLAACIENEPALIAELPAWTASRNRWKRRAAAVALLQEGKKGRNTKAIFRIADMLLADPDEMVQKGVGWVLKETYPKRPREVVEFLRPRAERTSRLLLRYAAEKMTPADRAAVLDRPAVSAARNADD